MPQASFHPDQHFTLAADVLFQRFEEKALLLDLASEKVYQLNGTGAHLTELLSAGRSLGEALASLDQAYASTSGQLESDVYALLADLLAKDLMVERQP